MYATWFAVDRDWRGLRCILTSVRPSIHITLTLSILLLFSNDLKTHRRFIYRQRIVHWAYTSVPFLPGILWIHYKRYFRCAGDAPWVHWVACSKVKGGWGIRTSSDSVKNGKLQRQFVGIVCKRNLWRITKKEWNKKESIIWCWFLHNNVFLLTY